MSAARSPARPHDAVQAARERRRFVQWGAASLASNAWAQGSTASRTARVGMLSERALDAGELARVDAFRATLRELGWHDARNLTLVLRYAGDDPRRLPALAIELLAARTDVIFAATAGAALAAKKASATGPIVFSALSDPVEQGLVAALARPGGNVTGVAINSSALIPKRLQLLKEAMPRLARVAVLLDPQQDEVCQTAWDALHAPAAAMHVAIERVSTGTPTDYGRTFARLSRAKVDAVLVPATTQYYNDARRLAELAQRHHLVYLAPVGDVDADRTLLAYGPLQIDAYRQAARYTDRILRGADPATLPVEQPTRYELILNRRVARQFGMTFPRSLLMRADKVID